MFQRPAPKAPEREPELELADTLDFEVEEPTNELPARTGRAPAGR
ncbi:MAG TPA: hypothetical protein VMJ10_13850 [Kofleriaceae bacterium]|nr:hypothetical protein [Kofleriaceae bacterium]